MADSKNHERWVVLGGTGTLGRALMYSLKARNIEAVSISRNGGDQLLDVLNTSALRKSLIKIRPSVVVHLVAVSSMEDCQSAPLKAWRIDTDLVDDIARLCADINIKLVYVSTDHLWADKQERPIPEESQPSAASVYGQTKIAAESKALIGLNNLVIRASFIGLRHWRSRPNFLEIVIEKLSSGTIYHGFTDYFSNLIDSWSLSTIMMDLVKQKAGGIFHVGSTECMSRYSMIIEIAQQLQLDSGGVHPALVNDHLAVPRNTFNCMSTQKLEDFIRVELPSMSQVVHRALKDTPL